MDFTSVPFQDLLLQNAGHDQLVGFLKQLDQQYINTTDEQSRFGTLQILAAVLKAHVLGLDDIKAEEECLTQYLKPHMIASFAQDSTTSTESVHVLEKTVAFFMARSMVLYNEQATFGQSTLLTVLKQLVHAMESEPDFVDLKPLAFIQSHAQDQEIWDQAQQTTITPLLDLECCLNLLNLFVRDLNENEEIKAFMSEETDEQLCVWMHLIFTVAVAMVPCTDIAVRNKLGHDLLPNLLRWQQTCQKVEWDQQVYWCTMLWDRTLEIYALPATNLLRLEIYGLIARFFDSYFGTGQVRKDLRFDARFFKILQSGLQSNDSLARKYATYILKRIIDFTDKNPCENVEWTPYFSWDYTQSQTYLEHWDDWFLLYDIMHESVIHLVEPVLPRFESLLHADLLDPSWWILLLYRGFQNDVASVKKGLLEFIFSRQDKFVLNKMCVQHMFVFGALFKTLDVASLFQVPTQGTLVSPFGEHFKTFLVNAIRAFEKDHDRIGFLRQLMHHISHVVSSYVPILYSMEALAQTEEMNAWGPDELKSLRVLVDRHRNFNIPATKQFLRKLGITAVVKLANTSVLSFSDVAKTISSLVNEYPLKTDSHEFKLIHYWLENKVSKDMSFESMLHGLKDRLKTYVVDLKSEDIPEAVLCTQANVLARTSVFVVSDIHGQLLDTHITELFAVFSEYLKKQTDDILFSRLLTLLDALWENIQVSFEDKAHMTTLLGLDQQHYIELLNRIDKKYLNIGQENVVDEDLVGLYLSLTRRMLLNQDTFEQEQRYHLIKQYYEKSLELIKYRNPSVDASHEMSKPAYLSLLNIVYTAARKYDYFELDCDDTLVSLVYGLQMKRTQEALRERSWGDSLSTFIRCKWECIENIVHYASEVQSRKIQKSLFDPASLYEEAIDQLESGSEMCGEAIIRSFGPLLALPWTKTPDMVMRCVDYSVALMKENAAQSRTYPLLMRAFIDVIFQPALLAVPELNQADGPIKKALQMVLQTGELKPYIVTQAAKLLHAYWSTFTPEADQSMSQYASEIAALAVFGPLRDREDQKLEAAFAAKLATPAEILDAEGTAQTVFSQNDYLVRVYVNDILLRLDLNNQNHIELANLLMDHLFRIVNEDILYEFMYMSTIEHRLKLRVCCSIMLIIDFATKDKLKHYFDQYFELMRKETVTSVRCYVEWALVRLLARYPDHLPVFYERLTDSSHKPNFVISLLTVTFTLCDIVPDAYAKAYFDDIFKRLMPWLITNHFTIRLFSYCAWQRNYKACMDRGYSEGIVDNKYIQSMNAFMDSYVDCIKYWDKLQQQFYMTKFDPVADYNVEFIFRQMLAEFDVIENERIGSKSFLRLNPTPVARCPFDNPARRSVYTSADPSEMIAVVTVPTQTTNEDVFQKKITPWEMMLETDMDLTKHLVQKNRKRNDLIVVASLIDRLPNLAGLCRTCEIFNASTLIVPSLKIKDDIGFTTVSVASEKWMPMEEVTEVDLPEFLQKKKDEGYTLCGLEQTTTSATLGSYEFPEKCVLLLGKERQGVPAHLLQMLDVTIEIPQYGITRSLNVHVSGAICIYEYTKQMQWRQQTIL